MRKRRVVIVRQRSRWTVKDWQRGWELAISRLVGVPPAVSCQPVFQECMAVLDGAFADGDKFRFELGLSTLMEFCVEAVNRGECNQWWDA